MDQLPMLEVPDGPAGQGGWLQDHTSPTHGCESSMSAAATRARRCRTPSSEHAAGHIPGAVFVDWEHDFIDAADPCRCSSQDRRRSPRGPASWG